MLLHPPVLSAGEDLLGGLCAEFTAPELGLCSAFPGADLGFGDSDFWV